jgi:hypothetical protein
VLFHACPRVSVCHVCLIVLNNLTSKCGVRVCVFHLRARLVGAPNMPHATACVVCVCVCVCSARARLVVPSVRRLAGSKDAGPDPAWEHGRYTRAKRPPGLAPLAPVKTGGDEATAAAAQ